MQGSTFTLAVADGVALFVRRWLPEAPPKAVVQIAHGLAEHGGRYARLAAALTAAGYAVYANDHRGHGRSAPSPEALGFFAAQDGWRKCVDDLQQLRRRIAGEHPGRPIVLLGHSMGSFMVQQLISEPGEELAGAVLSGSGGKPTPLAAAGRLVARLERLRLGARGRSALINAMSFGAFNRPFAPARTPFDWLSRDAAEVDKYIADPSCGFVATVQLWIDLLDALGDIARPARQARIPKHLPIYVIAGARDPVSDNTKGLRQLLAAYRKEELTRVTHRFYPDARHEILNELNRDEVTGELVAWLDAAVAWG
ncbi:MAG TPA: alpha/beta hydrolase [Stellaceae bacterium]|nr:alpha/beta hydrolase [Stellaceae bacterium]